MAIAHLRITAISRKKGHSTAAKAAYQSGTRLAADGHLHDYRRHARCVVMDELIMAQGAPAMTRADFWQTVEKTEKRKDACVGRALEASLPRELNTKQQEELARAFTQALIERWQLPAADLAIHAPTPYAPRKKKSQKKENPHIHLLIPDRDCQGKKLPWSRTPEVVKEIRQLWQDHVNRALEKAGLTARIDMRSYSDQALALAAEKEKIQAEITALEAKLQETEHADSGRKIDDSDPKTGPPHSVDTGPVPADHGRPGQAGRAAIDGRSASTDGPESAGRGHELGYRDDLEKSFSGTTPGKTIAARLDGLRLQRSAHFTMTRTICDRLDALRYMRSQAYTQDQKGDMHHEQEESHTPDSCGAPRPA